MRKDGGWKVTDLGNDAEEGNDDDDDDEHAGGR